MDSHIPNEETNFHLMELFLSSNNEVGYNENNINIPQYVGVWHSAWKNLNVVHFYEYGLAMAEGICCNSCEMDCVDATRLGLDHVGVLIFIFVFSKCCPFIMEVSLSR